MIYKPGFNSIKNFFSLLFIIYVMFYVSSCTSIEKKTLKETSYKTGLKQKTKIAVITSLSAEESNKIYEVVISGFDKSKLENYEILNIYIENNNIEKAVHEIKSNNVKIVLGPVFSNVTKSLSEHFPEKEIVFISMSNNPDIAKDNIFIFGHEPIKKHIFLIDHIISSEYKDFIIVFPSSKNSNKLARHLGEVITQKGGNVKESLFYSNKTDSIKNLFERVDQLINDYNEDINNKKKLVMLINETDLDILKSIFHKIKINSIDKRALISAEQDVDRFVGDLYNIDMIISGSVKKLDNKNIDIYKNLSPISLLFYDASMILSSLLDENYNRSDLIKKLSSLSNFDGYSGKISMENNIATRSYNIILKSSNIYHMENKQNTSEEPNNLD